MTRGALPVHRKRSQPLAAIQRDENFNFQRRSLAAGERRVPPAAASSGPSRAFSGPGLSPGLSLLCTPLWRLQREICWLATLSAAGFLVGRWSALVLSLPGLASSSSAWLRLRRA